jgi:hypothetical protein
LEEQLEVKIFYGEEASFGACSEKLQFEGTTFSGRKSSIKEKKITREKGKIIRTKLTAKKYRS